MDSQPRSHKCCEADPSPVPPPVSWCVLVVSLAMTRGRSTCSRFAMSQQCRAEPCAAHYLCGPCAPLFNDSNQAVVIAFKSATYALDRPIAFERGERGVDRLPG